MALQDAINYAKQNPTSSYAKELRRRLESGMLDSEAQQIGIDISKFKLQKPPKKVEGQIDPTFKASIGGTETIIPNTLKTFGNIPSSGANLIERAIGDPIRKGKESASVATDIYKDKGFKEGTKDIVSGFGETLANIFKAPGEFIVGEFDKEKFQKLQGTQQKVQDELLDKIAEKRQKGEDTKRLTDALSDLIVTKRETDDEAGGTPEERYNKGVENLTNIAKYPIERPADVALGVYGGPKAVGAKTTDAISDIARVGTGGFAQKAEQFVADTTKKIFTKSETQQLERSINAVNPDLGKVKLSKAYQEIVTGKRTATPSSVFAEQKLSPSEQIEALGTRLSGVLKSDDPLKNLNSLHDEFVNTETKIQKAFDSDPELQYNANKPELSQKLEEIKTKIPREFSSIRDSKSVYDNAIDFGQELLAKADDTPKGIREARTAFDTQARLEYPNAFKEGAVDMKTPAGRAIRDVRDAFNEHLYNTAPNGSEIQRLIGREADIYRAGEYIAQKAAKLHGTNRLLQWMKDNPGKAKVIGSISAAIGLGAIFGTAKAFTD